MKPTTLVFLAMGIAVVLSLRCSSPPDGSTPPTNVSGAFPTTLAFASPFHVFGGSAYVSKVNGLNSLLTAPNILKCRPSLELSVSYPDAGCFGPQLTYANHPQLAISGPPEDMGILYETDSSTSNACFAAQFNSRLAGIALLTDTAESALAAMFCVARVDGHPLPGVGQTLDMKPELSELFSIQSGLPTVESASIVRGANTAQGYADYVSTLVLKKGTQSISIRLRHIPTIADNSAHKGKISIAIADSAPSGGAAGLCAAGPSVGTGVVDVVSLGYEQSTAAQLKLALSGGHYCDASGSPYVSSTNFTVDPTKVYPTDPKGWSMNFTTAIFNQTLADGSGSYFFSWQNTAIDGHTRVLNTTIASASDVRSGCGYYGFGGDASVGAASAQASTFICNVASFQAPSIPDHTGTPKVQRQCFAQTPTGAFTSDPATLAITYAPVNGCDTADATFSMTPTAGGGAAVTGPITNNLYSISSIADLTVPTAPVDVDGP